METELTENEDIRIEMQSSQSEPNNKVNDSVVQEWHDCILGNETTQHSQRQCQMEKVPPLLLQGKKGRRNRDYYKPVVISLGPYHNKRNDLAAAEKYKLITLEEYRLSCGISMGSLYNKLFEVVHDARKCYIDGSTDEYTDEQFNLMMLRDGCFILFYIEGVASMNNKLLLNNEHLGALGFAHVARDIFLLENQIPFVVLQILLDLRFPDGGEEILNAFFNFLNYGEITTTEEKVLKKKQPLHLLELYRSHFISFSSSFGHGSINLVMRRRRRPDNAYWNYLWRIRDDEDWNYVKRNRSFASITELKSNWIFLKCTEDEDSNRAVKFHSHCCYGELELVRRVVFSNSKAIYLNMIAYELCPHNPNDFRVSTYIKVMKLLVIHCDDVKELRYKNILVHSLGRDEEVVKMYDEIDAPVFNGIIYWKLMQEVQKHCNNKYKMWVAELINTYFSSPWKAVALLAATTILFTSFLQDYFTIRPLPK